MTPVRKPGSNVIAVQGGVQGSFSWKEIGLAEQGTAIDNSSHKQYFELSRVGT